MGGKPIIYTAMLFFLTISASENTHRDKFDGLFLVEWRVVLWSWNSWLFDASTSELKLL